MFFFLLVASAIAIFDGQFVIRCWETIKQKYGAHFRWILVVLFILFCILNLIVIQLSLKTLKLYTTHSEQNQE